MIRDDEFNGTLRYASINAHYQIQLSRRDDLESLAYMLIHIVTDHGLPWNIDQGINHVKIQKELTDDDELCDGIPKEFGQFLSYAKSLNFEQEPDYDRL